MVVKTELNIQHWKYASDTHHHHHPLGIYSMFIFMSPENAWTSNLHNFTNSKWVLVNTLSADDLAMHIVVVLNLFSHNILVSV